MYWHLQHYLLCQVFVLSFITYYNYRQRLLFVWGIVIIFPFGWKQHKTQHTTDVKMLVVKKPEDRGRSQPWGRGSIRASALPSLLVMLFLMSIKLMPHHCVCHHTQRGQLGTFSFSKVLGRFPFGRTGQNSIEPLFVGQLPAHRNGVLRSVQLAC